MLQQGRVRSHLDDIAVPLNTDHEDGLCDRGLHDGEGNVNSIVLGNAGELANKVREGPVDIVEHVESTDHLVCCVVRVPVQPDTRRFRVRKVVWSTGDDGELRVCLLDSIVEARKSLRIARSSTPEVIFVADSHVRHWPRVRESVRCAERTVLRGRITENVLRPLARVGLSSRALAYLQFIENIVDIWLQGVPGDDWSVQGQSVPNHKDGLQVHILAPEEILVQTLVG